MWWPVISAMEFIRASNNFAKKVVCSTSGIVTNNFFVGHLEYFFWTILLDLITILHVFFDSFVVFFFFVWLRPLKIVPFKLCAKNDYYEDPGVVEMHALLRGEDCFQEYLEQQQKLPFPPPDFDPYDKIYLAAHFSRLQREIFLRHNSLSQSDNPVHQMIINSTLCQKMLRFVSSLVAVNCDRFLEWKVHILHLS